MFQNCSYFLSTIKVQPSDFSIHFENGEKIQLQPKLIEVLGYLAKQYPRVVPREEIIEHVWAGNSYVGEKALTNAIWNLRQKLHQPNQQEIIETIRKSGYRLLVQPEPEVIANEHDVANNLLQDNAVEKPQSSPQKRFNLAVFIFAILVIFMYVGWQQVVINNSLKETTFEQITTEPGNELFAAPSPDGRYIVYQWRDPQGIANLYMRDRIQPQLKAQQLTFDDAKQGFSVWSPDGHYLYFAQKDEANNSCVVVQMQVKTHEETIVTQCSKTGGYYYIDISADGKTLAYHGKTEDDDNAGIYFLDLSSKEFTKQRFSCNKNCPYKERDMSFSADGKFIAVTRRYSNFKENIFLINLTNNQEKQLTFSEEDIVGLTWHPDGKHIVFATQRADIRRGFMVEPETGKITDLNVDGFSYPKYSSQSAELFFQHRLEHYQVSSLSITADITTSPFPVLQSKFNHRSADYSLIQDKIAYVSNETGFYEVWLAESDGTQREQLTFLESTVKYPKWSYDGSKIAFLSENRADIGDNIFILDVKSKNIKQVESQFNRHNRPSWSFDDSAIISAVYGDEYTDLHMFNLTSGISNRITFNGGRYGVVSEDGQLYYSRGSGSLWKKSIDLNQSNSAAKNLISRTKLNTTYGWAYSAKGIYFNHNSGKGSQLNFYKFSDESIKTYLEQPKNAVADFTTLSIIPDKQVLLFTASSFPQADISKLEHPKLN